MVSSYMNQNICEISVRVRPKKCGRKTSRNKYQTDATKISTLFQIFILTTVDDFYASTVFFCFSVQYISLSRNVTTSCNIPPYPPRSGYINDEYITGLISSSRTNYEKYEAVAS